MSNSALEALSSSSNTIEISNPGSVGCIVELRGAAGAGSIVKREFFIG
jgi:hypothetical protein